MSPAKAYYSSCCSQELLPPIITDPTLVPPHILVLTDIKPWTHPGAIKMTAVYVCTRLPTGVDLRVKREIVFLFSHIHTWKDKVKNPHLQARWYFRQKEQCMHACPEARAARLLKRCERACASPHGPRCPRSPPSPFEDRQCRSVSKRQIAGWVVYVHSGKEQGW